MTRHRGVLIYLGLYLLFGGAWLAVTAYRLLAWPLIVAGSLTVALLAQAGEWAVVWWLDRPRTSRRRAHARPRSVRKTA